jgi:proteic killer suppression protein
VDITFATKKLAKLANDQSLCKRELGPKRSRIFLRRLNELVSARSLADTLHLPGHYHELSNDRKGQWACDLDQPYRLIFAPADRPIPVSNVGRTIVEEITRIVVIEIVDYH